MSGVRNLRAMFEQQQKGDGLPDRGRSPGPGGFASDSPSASPRPLSKVRTSFVAVEKDGRIGLRREPSEDSVSVSSRRKLSNDTDTTSERPDVFSDRMASTGPSRTNLSHEAIPESPLQDTPVKSSPQKEGKSPPLRPNANPDKVTDEEEPQTKMLSGNPAESSAARLGGTVFDAGASNILNGTTHTSANGTTSTTTKTKAANGSAKPTTKAAAPISTAKITSKPSKSSLTTKSTNNKEPTKLGSSFTATKRATATTTTATKTAASKPAPVNLAPASTGFVKPKPKSPTRPVKLPSTLTTHTASSSQKYGSGSAAQAPRQSLSRASGNAQHLSVDAPAHRSPSRNSVSTVGTTATRTLKHKPSTLGRSSRPSLGLPPKQETKSQPTAKRESQVNEDFLARMMRPTQSSAKKTSEKAPVTPPRKQAAPVRKPDPKDTEKTAKKVAAKIQGSSVKPKAAKDEIKSVAAQEQPTAKEIAPAVAQAETAEVAIESAKLSAETAEAPVDANDEDETLGSPVLAHDELAVESTAGEPAAIEKEIVTPIVDRAVSVSTAAAAGVPSTDGTVDVEGEAEPSADSSTEMESAPKSDTEAESVPEPSSEVKNVPETNAEIETTPEAIPEVETTPQRTTEPEAIPKPVAPVDANELTASAPVVSEDPLKVEDIEDIVKGTEQLGLQHEPTNGHESMDDTANVSELEEVPETNGTAETPAEEPKSEAQEAVEEPAKPEEIPVEAGKAADEEVKKESPATVDDAADNTADEGQKTATEGAVVDPSSL